MGDVLVFAEHKAGHFPKTTLVAVNAGIELAKKRGGGKCVAVIAGEKLDGPAAELAQYGMSKVVALDDPRLANYLADVYAQALTALAKNLGAEYVLATATAMGKDLLPRVAARLNAPMASEIVSIGDDGTLVRPLYAGNALATVEMDGPLKVVSVRATAFDSAKPGDSAAPVEKAAPETRSRRVKDAFRQLRSDQERSAAAHRGENRGLGRPRYEVGREFSRPFCEPLVDEMGPEWAPAARRSTPVSCPTIFRSDRPARWSRPSYTWRSESRERFSIWPDEGFQNHRRNQQGRRTPIFNVADYGLVADLFKAVPEMVEALKKVNAGSITSRCRRFKVTVCKS